MPAGDHLSRRVFCLWGSAMFELSMKTDIKRFEDKLNDLQRRQLPYAVRRAMTDSANTARDRLKVDMPRVFDRPTPFAVNAFYAKPATGKSIEDSRAYVAIRDYAPKGTPASKFLAPEILGGPRNVKRFERRLNFTINTASPQLLPGVGAMLDQYGNPSRQLIGQFLGHLRAFGDTGQNVSAKKLNRLDRRKLLTGPPQQRAKYFVGKAKGDGRPLAIYNVLGGGIVVPVFVFARRKIEYKKHFDFYDIARHVYEETFRPRLAVRFAEAWATRR